jgi:predicted aconitase with swiveling domain
MKKTFKGRVITAGKITGKALVSHEGLNPLAAWKDALLKGKSPALCGDQNNIDLYKKQMDGKILCLPQCIGSTTAGLVIQIAAQIDLGPRAFLFSEHIDSLAASGIVISEIWQDKPIITIDQLGKEFLNYVKDEMLIEIQADGTIFVE